MGVQLDWEVEADGEWSEAGEDESAARHRHNRNRRRLLAIVGGLLLVGLAAGGVLFAVRRANAKARAQLDETIAAETSALRIGDRAAFLAAQEPQGEWQRVQSDTFDAYQALAGQLDVTGQVTDLTISGRRARVTLREVLNGRAYHVVWFYESTGAGWRHIPSQPDFWGPPVETQSAAFDVTTRADDQALVTALLPQIDTWWSEGCGLIACTTQPSRPRLLVVPNSLAQPGWADYDPWTLIVPSPLLGRLPDDGQVDTGLAATLAGQIARRWAEIAVPTSSGMSASQDADWLQGELAVRLKHAFIPSSPPSTFFDSLTTAYGSDIIPRFLTAFRADPDLVASLERVTGLDVYSLPVSASSYFAYLLRADASLGDNAYTAQLFQYYALTGTPRGAEIDFPTERRAVPGSVIVTNIHGTADALLAEVHFHPLENPTQEAVAYEPFRLLNGHWLHTPPMQADWGAAHETYSRHFTLRYADLDAGAVDGLLPYLEQVYGQAAADFGLSDSPMPNYLVVVTPDDAGAYITTHPDARSETDALVIPSPYVLALDMSVSRTQAVRSLAARELITRLVVGKLGVRWVDTPLVANMWDNEPIINAFVEWEMKRAGVPDVTPLPESMPASDGASGGDTTTGSPFDGTWISRGLSATNSADYVAAQALVGLLVDDYGAQSVPLLVSNLSNAASLDEWLSTSLGIHVSDIQERWQGRYAALAGAQEP